MKKITALGLIILVIAAAPYWIIREELQQAAKQQVWAEQYWELYVTDAYERWQGWGFVEETLDASFAVYSLMLEGQLYLSLQDEQGHTKYQRNTDQWKFSSSKIKSRSIVVAGQKIGQLDVSFQSKMSLGLFKSLAIHCTLLVIIGAGGWMLYGSRLRRQLLRILQEVEERLRRMVSLPGSMKQGQQEALHAIASADSSSSLRYPNGLMAGIEAQRQAIERTMQSIEQHVGKLERVRKTMVADIAHELRTPLAVIRAKLENALSEQVAILPEELVLLHDECYRMTKLIHDLNQLVLAESGHLPLERSWFSLSELIEQLVDTMSPEAEERQIVLELEHNDAPFQLYADRMRVQQVLVNLLGNALKHAKSKITIQLEQDAYAVCVAIMDDGQGIDEEDLPYLFERFYRPLIAAQPRHAASLGLGLAIVKEYVQAHGGEITVQSQWGVGSVFQVQLPIFKE